MKPNELHSGLMPLGGGFSIQLSASLDDITDGVGVVSCFWHPTLPSQGDFRSKIDLALYQSAILQFSLEVRLAYREREKL